MEMHVWLLRVTALIPLNSGFRCNFRRAISSLRLIPAQGTEGISFYPKAMKNTNENNTYKGDNR